MSDAHYKIVFDGQLAPGFDQAQVRRNLQELFSISEARTAQMFTGQPVVIKSGLTADKATDYLERMGRAGAVVRMIAMKTAQVRAPGAAATMPPPRTGQDTGESGNVRAAGFRFTGNGKEYFGIWIVNILLTIVTLGIYSAWAKVRNHQYFYGNTQLDDASFQYLASPITILKGRLVALAALVLYSLIFTFVPALGLLVLVAFVFGVPWIIIRALRFNAVNTAYRNVRFDFQGRYRDALMLTLVWPVLNLLCLMLLTPLVARKSHQFLFEGLRFGTSPFQWQGETGTYYRFFGIGALLALGVAGGAVVGSLVHPILGGLVMLAGYLGLFGYFKAGLDNLMVNHAELDSHQFESELEPIQLAWIFVSNSFLTVITLGLFTPWAKIRMARYRASCTSMIIQGSLDHFVAAESQRTSAMGEELGEAFDVGLAAI